jgi:hypothetical protein
MRTEINNSRFVPYIQQYEFECFIFCNLDIVKKYFSDKNANIKNLENAEKEFSTPEEINNSPQTAPSKRLMANLKGYRKVIHGALLVSEIGLQNIRTKCPRFNQWLENLELI